MNYTLSVLSLLLFLNSFLLCSCNDDNDEKKLPTVGITSLVRNQAHTLPQFLTSLMNLDYPKDRIFLWFRSDYNSDHSVDVLRDFVNKFGTLYNRVHLSYNTSKQKFDDELSPTHWSHSRFMHLIKWREMGIKFAKRQWADYVFMLDADVFLTNPQTLRHLIQKQLRVVAPMLVSDRYYSNFWLSVDDDFNYRLNHEDEFYPLYEYNELYMGCHIVPVIYGAVLMDLRSKKSDYITYDPYKIVDYLGPLQDHIIFAVNAMRNNISLHICNDDFFGYITRPIKEGEPLERDVLHLTNLKLSAIARSKPLQYHYKLQRFVYYPPSLDYQVDKIYMINLERRPDKRKLMEQSFKELGMNVTRVEAVDGKSLDPKKLQNMNVTLMPGYEDAYYKRPMTYGEIGCFLSHYKIWVEVAERNYNRVLILEDDVNFLPYFKENYDTIIWESSVLKHDFIYLGRKIMMDKVEIRMTTHLTKPLYSYWTIGYIITKLGAEKLIEAKPLSKLLPVDEFLPIMFDQHPDKKYKEFFPNRNLNALAASPSIISPTHYTGMPGYISDTEDSIPLSTEPCTDNPEL
ncbi:glycosyltransferase 25 family member like protein [Danaus plexippus plexippus]|uniref:Glycosyltransferase 25 family member like protein n=1 Tax=Danaus plexippus plexippus TaxID=278856 RepID=A0A212EMN5_DANPL|nr:glycosyltransferase 25 family member like protein [Danaus plexippus plexippus]